MATITGDRISQLPLANPLLVSDSVPIYQSGGSPANQRATVQQIIQATGVYYVATSGVTDHGVATTGSLKTVCDAADTAGGGTVVCPVGAYALGTSYTVPASVHLLMNRGAIITVATGVTLTIAGDFSAGRYQTFAWAGTGNVDFLAKGDLMPEWWGATPDAVESSGVYTGTDNIAALDACCGAFPSEGGFVDLGFGQYGVLSAWRLPTKIRARGLNRSAAKIVSLSGFQESDGYIVKIGHTTGTPNVTHGSSLEQLTVRCSKDVSDVICIYGNSCNENTYLRNIVARMGIGTAGGIRVDQVADVSATAGSPNNFVMEKIEVYAIDGHDEDSLGIYVDCQYPQGMRDITIFGPYARDYGTKWEAATAYAENNLVRPTTHNGYIYICTVAGTSHATTEPTWPTVIDDTVVDQGATWKCSAAIDALLAAGIQLSGNASAYLSAIHLEGCEDGLLIGGHGGTAADSAYLVQANYVNGPSVNQSVVNLVRINGQGVGVNLQSVFKWAATNLIKDDIEGETLTSAYCPLYVTGTGADYDSGNNVRFVANRETFNKLYDTKLLGGLRAPRNTFTEDGNVTSSMRFVDMNCQSNDVELTLPSITTALDGMEITVVKNSGDYTGTVVASGSQKLYLNGRAVSSVPLRTWQEYTFRGTHSGDPRWYVTDASGITRFLGSSDSAVPQIIAQLAVEDESVVIAQATVVAKNAAASNRAVYRFSVGVYRDGGGEVTILGGPASHIAYESVGAWNCVFAIKKTQTVTSITSVTTTATVTSTAHGFYTGEQITIAGADQTEYNGVYTITSTGADTFTYTFAGSATSPATGTITAARTNVGANVLAVLGIGAAGTDITWKTQIDVLSLP